MLRGTLTRARGARRRFQIAVSFFSFSSADRAGDAAVGGAGRRWCRRRGSIAAELRGGCRRPPAPPRRRRGAASTIFGTLTRARGARRRFQIAVSFFSFSSADRAGDAAVGGAGRRWCRRRSSIAAELRGGCRRPPAPPRRRRGAALPFGFPFPRAREGGASAQRFRSGGAGAELWGLFGASRSKPLAEGWLWRVCALAFPAGRSGS